jgi:hypothetical protein
VGELLEGGAIKPDVLPVLIASILSCTCAGHLIYTKHEIRAVVISNNDCIALGNINATAAIWSINKGGPIGKHQMEGDNSIISLAFNPKK